MNIKARMIIEILGFPAEALKKTLAKIVEEIKTRVDVTDEEHAEPKPAGQGKILSSFVELEFTAPDFEKFMGIMIDFGPTNVEILEPQKMEIGINEMQNSFNDLLQRLQELSNKLQVLQANNLILGKMVKDKQETPK